MKATNHGPMFDCANACTELTTPLRVRNVPRIHNRKVRNTSHTFHTFIIPRFSCIITECRNAVPVSQGKNDAFSTGSQPQRSEERRVGKECRSRGSQRYKKNKTTKKEEA